MKRLSTFIFLMFVACSKPAPRAIDQAKFEGVYRAAKATEAATNVGVTYAKLGELIQNFAMEVSIARDRTSDPGEVHMVDLYGSALQIYEDSMALWKARMGIQDPDGGLICTGDANLERIAQKYDLIPNENSRYTSLKVIPADAMKLLWLIASDELARANSVYFNKPQSATNQDSLKAAREALFLPLTRRLKADKEEQQRKDEENHKQYLAAEAQRQANLAVLRATAERNRASAAVALKDIENLPAEMRAIAKREILELDPDGHVWWIEGEPYYHFGLKCPNIRNKVPQAKMMPLGEARLKLRRCPLCQSPLDKK